MWDRSSQGALHYMRQLRKNGSINNNCANWIVQYVVYLLCARRRYMYICCTQYNTTEFIRICIDKHTNRVYRAEHWIWKPEPIDKCAHRQLQLVRWCSATRDRYLTITDRDYTRMNPVSNHIRICWAQTGAGILHGTYAYVALSSIVYVYILYILHNARVCWLRNNIATATCHRNEKLTLPKFNYNYACLCCVLVPLYSTLLMLLWSFVMYYT